jgi:hypothetical protein
VNSLQSQDYFALVQISLHEALIINETSFSRESRELLSTVATTVELLTKYSSPLASVNKTIRLVTVASLVLASRNNNESLLSQISEDEGKVVFDGLPELAMMSVEEASKTVEIHLTIENAMLCRKDK